MSSPATIIRQFLISNNLVTASGEWPCYIASLPDAPDACVAVYDTGAEKDGRLMKGDVIEHPSVQIQIRALTYPVGWSKANEIKDALDGILRSDVTVSSTTYRIHSVRRPSGVLPMGAEPGTSTRRELFSLNILLTINQQ